MFSNQVPSASLEIAVNDTEIHQPVLGFGGSLTDSSAQLLSDLKQKNLPNYWSLINYLFSPNEDANAAGLSYLRVPLGATNFAAQVYSYDDFDGDVCLNDFNVDYAPAYVFEVLADIRSVNSMLRVHLVPWSPPAWMKDSGTALGGSLAPQYAGIYAQYLFKCLENFKAKGVTAYAISIQNEPLNEDVTVPTAKYTPQLEAQVGRALKSLMLKRGWEKTKLIGYEDNWVNATSYPMQLMELAGDVFDAVAFHCYSGSVGQQDAFHSAYPGKEIHLTECSGTLGSDWWSDIKRYIDTTFIGSIEHNAQAALMWNLALDGSGGPKLPDTVSCGSSGCRGVVTVNNNGTWNVSREFYAMAQISKGTILRDIGGQVLEGLV